MVGRKGWQRVGERLARAWRSVGEGLAKGWRRVSGFPCTLQFRNSRGARLETLVCDSMVGALSIRGNAAHVRCRNPPLRYPPFPGFQVGFSLSFLQASSTLYHSSSVAFGCGQETAINFHSVEVHSSSWPITWLSLYHCIPKRSRIRVARHTRPLSASHYHYIKCL